MSTNIPQWALDRAWKLIRQTEPALSFSKEPAKAWMFAFARYIAAHEEPPVEPLLIEARNIVATTERMRVGRNTPFIDEVMDGKLDHEREVQQALAALKRGIEIGKSNA